MPRSCGGSRGSTSRSGSGLNSGEVVVRAIGSDLHMDYTAVGQTTHLAARMEQLARPGTTLLTADTLRLAEGYVEVTPLGPVPVKGLQEPVEVYELVRAGPVRSRLQAAAARGLTRFVGRDARAGAAAPGAGTRRSWAGAGGGRRRGGGRGQVPLAVRVHPVAPHPRLAAAGQPLGVLWQGHRLPARDRPAQGLLPDRTPGRRPPPAREGHGQAADARPRPGADAARLAGAAGGAGRGPAVAGLRSPATPPAHPRGRQAPAAARKPGPAAVPGVRGPALDRCRDPGAAGQPGREPAHGPAAAPGQLPPGVPARLGQQDLLHAAPARPAAPGERRRVAPGAAGG